MTNPYNVLRHGEPADVISLLETYVPTPEEARATLMNLFERLWRLENPGKGRNPPRPDDKATRVEAPDDLKAASLEELKRLYPACPEAVEFGETTGTPLWQEARDNGFTLGKTVDYLRMAMSLARTLVEQVYGGDGAALAKSLDEQLATLDFRRYVAVKLKVAQDPPDKLRDLR